LFSASTAAVADHEQRIENGGGQTEQPRNDHLLPPDDYYTTACSPRDPVNYTLTIYGTCAGSELYYTWWCFTYYLLTFLLTTLSLSCPAYSMYSPHDACIPSALSSCCCARRSELAVGIEYLRCADATATAAVAAALTAVFVVPL